MGNLVHCLRPMVGSTLWQLVQPTWLIYSRWNSNPYVTHGNRGKRAIVQTMSSSNIQPDFIDTERQNCTRAHGQFHRIQHGVFLVLQLCNVTTAHLSLAASGGILMISGWSTHVYSKIHIPALQLTLNFHMGMFFFSKESSMASMLYLQGVQQLSISC